MQENGTIQNLKQTLNNLGDKIKTGYSSVISDPTYVTIAVIILVVIIISYLAPHKEAPVNTKPLIIAAKQWAEASQVDSDPLASVLHVSYASAYLQAARSVMSDRQIESQYGEIEPLIDTIAKQQKIALSRLQEKKTRVPAYRAKTISDRSKNVMAV